MRAYADEYNFEMHNPIVAKQKPKIPQDPLYDINVKYENGTDRIYYWIIIKKENLVLGPLGFEEFKKESNKYHF